MSINYDLLNLKDKTAVITGGAGVLGASICDSLAIAGLKIAILDINKKAADITANRISNRKGAICLGVEADVLNKESLNEAKRIVNEEFGLVDILINGAGGNSPKATTKLENFTLDNINDPDAGFFGLDIEAFRYTFDLNFIGTLIPSMVFSKDMINIGKGNILNLSSMSAYHPLTKVPAYSAAKSSINNFTEWLAVHLAKTGIRVNAVAPGFFLTTQNEFLLTEKKSGKLTKRGKKILNNTPMNRFGKPKELHGTVLYLISDMSEFITGVVIPVDGGFNAFSGV